ncbi:response regulator, partial [Paenibacillus zanthoxyli]|uniref:response regulator n=1 Tax=Paenibacillus zanthoxyli TaxID=369399 RepID=UPI00047176A2
MDRSIKVLLVEDDPVWRENLKSFLSREQDITIVGTAKTKEGAIDLFEQSVAVDVVLMDIMLTPPDQYDGIDTALQLRKLGMEKIIMLTSLDEKEVILDAFDKGAINYICKTSYTDIPEAIREAHNNKVALRATGWVNAY